jgi:hypothetical protein
MTTTHIATIGTAADVVTGDHCDLTLYRAKAEVIGYDGDDDRTEWIADGDGVYDTDLTIRIGDDHEQAMAEADAILEKRGMTRVGNWVDGGVAWYAEVEASTEEQLTELAQVSADLEMLTARRHMLVQSLMQAPASEAPRTRIAAAARLKEARLYQIRDGRR